MAERKTFGKLVEWAQKNGKSAHNKRSHVIIDGREVFYEEALEILKDANEEMEQSGVTQ